MKHVALLVVLFLVYSVTYHHKLSDNSTGASMSQHPGYGFYRKLTWWQEVLGHNRLFESGTGNLTQFAAACVLLNEHFSPRCSAAVVAPRWAVTAAHCITKDILYLLYNGDHSSSREGKAVEVLDMYRHPEYKVEEKHEDKDDVVIVLTHDVGLVYVAKDMILKFKLQADPLVAMTMYKPAEIKEHELQVMGFGHTKTPIKHEELLSVKMRVVNCSSSHWLYCICGVPSRPTAEHVSVCMADSGGPVLYRGVQVAVTSLGPVECALQSAEPPPFATSVFTVLYPYADLINDTIHNKSHTIQMVQLALDGCVSIKSNLTHVVLGLVACSFIRLVCGDL